MSLESIELKIARTRIERYVHEAADSIVRDSHQAQDCLDLEAFLAVGINAFNWLERSEEVLREAIAEGLIERDAALRISLQTLYKSWLQPCSFADDWIAKQQRNGYQIGNLAAFRESCDLAGDRLERNDWAAVASKSQARRFAEETW